MSVLAHKLKRDLLASTGVLLTVIAIIAVGTGSFIGFGSAQKILENSQKTYYNDYRLADFWVDVKKAPLSEIESIAQMPEIAFLEARVVFDVILDLPSITRPISGRLISVPAEKFDQSINGLCLVRGSGFSPDRDEEVILGRVFCPGPQPAARQPGGTDPEPQAPVVCYRRYGRQP